MNYDLLEHIRHASLPIRLEGEDADTVKAYVAAGLVVAEFTESVSPSRHIATVVNLTAMGRKTIDAHATRKSLARFISRK
jgi:hypothetical protein